jgi:hypothetical protein
MYINTNNNNSVTKNKNDDGVDDDDDYKYYNNNNNNNSINIKNNMNLKMEALWMLKSFKCTWYTNPRNLVNFWVYKSCVLI